MTTVKNTQTSLLKHISANYPAAQKADVIDHLCQICGFSLSTFYYKNANASFKPIEKKAIAEALKTNPETIF